MGRTWAERYAETQAKSTGLLEEILEDRRARGEETGVIEAVLQERRDEEEAWAQYWEEQHNAWGP